VRLVTVAMMIAMGAYGLMVILAPEFLLGLFYGGQYTGYGGVVQLYALMYFLMNSTLVLSLGIDSLARPDRTFLITMCAGVVALVVAFPLVRWWDVYGAALGMVVTQTVVLGGAWCLFEVSLRERAEAISQLGMGRRACVSYSRPTRVHPARVLNHTWAITG
jgi:O-antigen/teichoic acid export membrane protein